MPINVKIIHNQLYTQIYSIISPNYNRYSGICVGVMQRKILTWNALMTLPGKHEQRGKLL